MNTNLVIERLLCPVAEPPSADSRILFSDVSRYGMFSLDGSGTERRVVDMPAPLDKVADYTLALVDANGRVRMNKATGVNLTVDSNANVPFPDDTKIEVISMGAGTTTIVAGSGVTIRGTLTVTQYARKTLIKVNTNEWILV